MNIRSHSKRNTLLSNEMLNRIDATTDSYDPYKSLKKTDIEVSDVFNDADYIKTEDKVTSKVIIAVAIVIVVITVCALAYLIYG